MTWSDPLPVRDYTVFSSLSDYGLFTCCLLSLLCRAYRHQARERGLQTEFVAVMNTVDTHSAARRACRSRECTLVLGTSPAPAPQQQQQQHQEPLGFASASGALLEHSSSRASEGGVALTRVAQRSRSETEQAEGLPDGEDAWLVEVAMDGEEGEHLTFSGVPLAVSETNAARRRTGSAPSTPPPPLARDDALAWDAGGDAVVWLRGASLEEKVGIAVNALSVVSNCLTLFLRPSQVLYTFLFNSADYFFYMVAWLNRRERAVALRARTRAAEAGELDGCTAQILSHAPLSTTSPAAMTVAAAAPRRVRRRLPRWILSDALWGARALVTGFVGTATHTLRQAVALVSGAAVALLPTFATTGRGGACGGEGGARDVCDDGSTVKGRGPDRAMWSRPLPVPSLAEGESGAGQGSFRGVFPHDVTGHGPAMAGTVPAASTPGSLALDQLLRGPGALLMLNVLLMALLVVCHMHHLFFHVGALAGYLACAGILFLLGEDLARLSLRVHNTATCSRWRWRWGPLRLWRSGKTAVTAAIMATVASHTAELPAQAGAVAARSPDSGTRTLLFIGEHLCACGCSAFYLSMLADEGEALWSTHVEFMRWYVATIALGLRELLLCLEAIATASEPPRPTHHFAVFDCSTGPTEGQ